MLSVKERVTISLDPEVLKAVRADVEKGRTHDLSTAVEEALFAQQRTHILHDLLDDLEAEHGPISKETKEWGRRELERAFQEVWSSTPVR
jgi:Arc/MetJ-type ribon-helix-helix transcriptional regulator